MDFQGKVALITGASSGIGLETAKKFVALGAKVALIARTEKKLIALEKELGESNAKAFPCDVSALDRLERLPSEVASRFGRLDILINNAGLNHRGNVMRHDPKDLAAIINTNLTAPIVLTRSAIPFLDHGGSVVFVASIAGMIPVPGEATYSASKAGLRAFSRALQEDLESRHIHVGCVSPGPVDTGFFGDELSEVPDLVFSQPMSTAGQIADAIIECINARVMEIAVPAPSGRLATLGYLFPTLSRSIRPALEKRGRALKQAYLHTKSRTTP